MLVNNQKKHLVLTKFDRLILYEKDPYSSLIPKADWILELRYLVSGIDLLCHFNMISLTVNQIMIKRQRFRASSVGND